MYFQKNHELSNYLCYVYNHRLKKCSKKGSRKEDNYASRLDQ